MFLIQLLFQPLFPGESGVDQLVEIMHQGEINFIIFPTVFVNILYTIITKKMATFLRFETLVKKATSKFFDMAKIKMLKKFKLKNK
jgi:hypothetical protein